MKSLEERKQAFIDKSKKLYGDLFDYSDVDYVNAKTPITLHRKDGITVFITPDEHFRGTNRGNSNSKPYNYWNDKNNCLQEALKYNSRKEFNKKSIGAYNGAKRNNWLNECCSHMKTNMQTYDDNAKIHCIYVYELKELNTCYIGRTKQLTVRDRQHRNGVYRKGKIEYDNLNLFCKNKGINMPEPIILENNLTAIESQIQEKYWLDKYINDNWYTLNKAAVGEGISSLGGRIKWTYDKTKEEALKYKTRNEFKLKNQSAYNASKKHKWLDEFIPDLKKKTNGYWNDLNNCKNAVKQCSSVKELMTKFGGCYNSIRKHNWFNEIEYKQI